MNPSDFTQYILPSAAILFGLIAKSLLDPILDAKFNNKEAAANWEANYKASEARMVEVTRLHKEEREKHERLSLEEKKIMTARINQLEQDMVRLQTQNDALNLQVQNFTSITQGRDTVTQELLAAAKAAMPFMTMIGPKVEGIERKITETHALLSTRKTDTI